MALTSDIVVLGAGMVGVGAALALQARGRDIILVERGAPGGETSHGNAGIIQGEARQPYALPAARPSCGTSRSRRGAPALLRYRHYSAPVRHRSRGDNVPGQLRRAHGMALDLLDPGGPIDDLPKVRQRATCWPA